MGSDRNKKRRQLRGAGKWLGLIWAGLLLAGCNGVKGDYLSNISSAKPDVATSAMNQAAQKKSRQAIVPLIKRLHDEDPAIRLSAIRALQSITGQDLGYRSYEPPTKRAQAIQRWWDWLRQENLEMNQEVQASD